MSTSASPKLQHAFKEKTDTRKPTETSKVQLNDEDRDKKPTTVVSRGDELVYEYKDPARVIKVAPPQMSIDQLIANYKMIKQNWKDLHDAKKRLAGYQQALDQFNKHPINQIICTGIGSPSGYMPGVIDCNALYQLAELEAVMVELESHGIAKDAAVFFQDPSFNEIDREFLKGRGYTIIDHPEAYNRMTTGTFLYAPGTHDDVVYHAFRVAMPALFGGNNLVDYGISGLPNPDNFR